jgi:hypothetical protein
MQAVGGQAVLMSSGDLTGQTVLKLIKGTRR